MDKCECWELQKTKIGWYGTTSLYNSRVKQICNGTKEREECTCGGDVSKCDFYPEKRKEGEHMNTAEMWLKAQKDGRTYQCVDMNYNKKKGFYGEEVGCWLANAFHYVEDIFNLKWTLHPSNEMTKSEAEAKFNIKIEGD